MSKQRQIVVLIVVLALVQATIGLEAKPAAAGSTGGSDSCELKAKEAKDCSLCCAIGGFNKFDSQRFQAGRGCHCFNNEDELALNQRHRPRKP